ncbi:MAG: hypothetical protein VSS75_010300, partial [Candidatus Parabeggiatoa sp.]|nr:hypothetical protein [Candidatus Parabeggiatoa sp.]
VTCYYPHPIITERNVNSTYGWIAVLDAPMLRQALDRLPNSLLMETQKGQPYGLPLPSGL